jgi:hypothetical protein
MGIFNSNFFSTDTFGRIDPEWNFIKNKKYNSFIISIYDAYMVYGNSF